MVINGSNVGDIYLSLVDNCDYQLTEVEIADKGKGWGALKKASIVNLNKAKGYNVSGDWLLDQLKSRKMILKSRASKDVMVGITIAKNSYIFSMF